ncbi:MAG: CopG family transcriptional regulator [Spirochaetaceae bacterium]|nr:MAG: CopG family transcriptional regulator [Spirochaetaceae bacterium]
MKAKDFDRKFDEGKEDIIEDLDLSTARRVNRDQKRINVDFPTWVVDSLDREAARIGVTRQSIIKVWLVERLKAEAGTAPYSPERGEAPIRRKGRETRP